MHSFLYKNIFWRDILASLRKVVSRAHAQCTERDPDPETKHL